MWAYIDYVGLYAYMPTCLHSMRAPIVPTETYVAGPAAYISRINPITYKTYKTYVRVYRLT